MVFKKNFLLLISTIAVTLLAACSSQQVALTTPMPGVDSGTAPQPVATIDTASQANEAFVPAACTVVKLVPTQGPTEESLFPSISDADWVLGPADAALTILEYSDLQCPYCALFEPTAARLQQDYPDEVRLAFRHFPLNVHDKALLGAQALEAAGSQGHSKFFELKDRIFEQRDSWVEMRPEDFESWLIEEAEKIGLDPARFAAALNSEEITAKVRQAQDDAIRIQIPGTPFVLVNGMPYQGPRDYDSLESILKLFLLEKRQYNQCPPMEIKPARTYTATIETANGDIVVELFADQAPTAVNNFVFLARAGWYDRVMFHRVLPGFLAQAGDPSGTGYGGPGYAFGDEISPDLAFDRPGMVAMANSGADTNGSQFFITLGDTENLNGKYTVFGQVIKGLDVAQSLTARDPAQASDLPAGTLITTIRIEEQ